ncbi:MAG: hypothetical protein ONB44_08505 [candidate division KSB1 bacterium]|nr:hypothetical protein [candidate division KSB1 bacterium]MDZ7302170.1 hypothetical protein [candidate division KSB1 bacterium]MDZ7311279.1 hypothetical protein [candidate division KSB1 bacterium]
MKAKFISVLLLLGCVLMFVEQSLAIPAFARKYDMSCNVCHSPIPKLKPYGEDFAGDGFQLPDKEPPRYYRETGDDRLLLMRELPLALRLEGWVRYQPQTAKRSDFQSPYLLKILSGGQIARNVSYYFYFFFSERGEVAGIEDAFIMFNKLFRTELDVSLGQFQVSDPLFKRELRLTLEDYQIYRTRVGYSRINLTYDRGLMLAYTLPTKTDVVLEILNGNGIGGADANRNFDSDKYKNGFLRVSQDVGKALRLGGFGYYGKEEQLANVNTLWMAGPDLTLSLDQIELNVQYLERRDDDPFFVSADTETKTRGAFAELIYSPQGDKSNWYGALLYNWVDSDQKSLNYQSATGHFSYLAARNLRLVGEYTYDFERKANKFSVGFVSAF